MPTRRMNVKMCSTRKDYFIHTPVHTHTHTPALAYSVFVRLLAPEPFTFPNISSWIKTSSQHFALQFSFLPFTTRLEPKAAVEQTNRSGPKTTETRGNWKKMWEKGAQWRAEENILLFSLSLPLLNGSLSYQKSEIVRCAHDSNGAEGYERKKEEEEKNERKFVEVIYGREYIFLRFVCLFRNSNKSKFSFATVWKLTIAFAALLFMKDVRQPSSPARQSTANNEREWLVCVPVRECVVSHVVHLKRIAFWFHRFWYSFFLFYYYFRICFASFSSRRVVKRQIVARSRNERILSCFEVINMMGVRRCVLWIHCTQHTYSR